VLGWRTTTITKPLAIDELNQALREGQLHVHDADCIAELRTFIREGDGKMHGSPFDDRVMALAIAAQMLKYVWLREFQPINEPPPGTWGYMERMMFGKLDRVSAVPVEREPIGRHYVRSQR
jgi:hypothetical protein